jgi:anti-sigma B factor antagonist
VAAVTQPEDPKLATVRPLALPEIVSLPTEMDIGSSDAIGEQLLAAFHPSASVVIADMSRTEYCDSSVIRQLTFVDSRVAAAGGELRIVLTSQAIWQLLRLFGVDQTLRLYPDMQSALTGPPQLQH